jgi:hypothetical protein
MPIGQGLIANQDQVLRVQAQQVAATSTSSYELDVPVSGDEEQDEQRVDARIGCHAYQCAAT